MSRGIPPVRRWRVTYWLDGRVLAATEVDTINKRFARWLARERAWLAHANADKVTVSLSRAAAPKRS
jgi:hypothetical protein